MCFFFNIKTVYKLTNLLFFNLLFQQVNFVSKILNTTFEKESPSKVISEKHKSHVIFLKSKVMAPLLRIVFPPPLFFGGS